MFRHLYLVVHGYFQQSRVMNMYLYMYRNGIEFACQFMYLVPRLSPSVVVFLGS